MPEWRIPHPPGTRLTSPARALSSALRNGIRSTSSRRRQPCCAAQSLRRRLSRGRSTISSCSVRYLRSLRCRARSLISSSCQRRLLRSPASTGRSGRLITSQRRSQHSLSSPARWLTSTPSLAQSRPNLVVAGALAYVHTLAGAVVCEPAVLGYAYRPGYALSGEVVVTTSVAGALAGGREIHGVVVAEPVVRGFGERNIRGSVRTLVHPVVSGVLTHTPGHRKVRCSGRIVTHPIVSGVLVHA
jgi:hypothetical protein